jgi:NTP pyrophosphatase (non-canonical NTP hydrolase)
MRAEDLELCRGFPSSAYVDFALGTSPLPVLGHPSVFPAMGLCEEAGEVMGKIKKTIRDGGGDFDKTREAIRLELGDVLWYLTATADALGYTLDDIMIGNATKLAGRRKRGTVLGSGDDR